MPILFCNIAWMKRYEGRDPKDPPQGGGAFIGTDGWGGEELNFVPGEDGYVYGYFETNTKDVLIERLGVAPGDEYIDDVDIVWTAPIKGHEPHVIVGWYKGARASTENSSCSTVTIRLHNIKRTRQSDIASARRSKMQSYFRCRSGRWNSEAGAAGGEELTGGMPRRVVMPMRSCSCMRPSS